MRKHYLAVAAALTITTGLPMAWAQQAGGGAAVVQPSAENVAEARKRYQLGLQLYEDGNYEAARIEFERAYALAPSFKILYNVGLVYRQLNNYVDALKSFERYLSEGKGEVPADRRAEVEKEVVELRRRIASVRVTANVDGAEIAIDDIAVGKAPLSEAVLINPGVRKITATFKGRIPATKSITVGSGEGLDVRLELAEPTTKILLRERNPWVVPTVVSWSVTGAALVSSVVLGVLALNGKEDLDAKRNAPPPPGQSPADFQADMNNQRDKNKTLSAASDVLLGVTIGVPAWRRAARNRALASLLRVERLAEQGIVVKVAGSVAATHRFDAAGELRRRIVARFEHDGLVLGWRPVPPPVPARRR